MSERVDGNLNKDMGDDYLVAADLTLYANPLRVLHSTTAKPPPKQGEKKEQEAASSKGTDKGGDIIAADLTKYGSPLDDRKK